MYIHCLYVYHPSYPNCPIREVLRQAYAESLEPYIHSCIIYVYSSLVVLVVCVCVGVGGVDL